MEIITENSKIGSWFYPFLQNYSGWQIVSYEKGDQLAQNTTLRFVTDKVTDVIIPDGNGGIISADEYLQREGITVGLDKGPFVMSKRLSRIMRRYAVAGNVPEVKIQHTDNPTWDGAGVISRKFLMSLRNKMKPGIEPQERSRWIRELRTANRVEFTINTDRGQLKGHALVTDEDVEWDILCPHDYKSEVLTDKIFVGINFVHAKDDYRLDIQSLINLSEFFEMPLLMRHMREEADLFIESVESGEYEAVLAKVDPQDVSDWHVIKYLNKGYKASWFAGITRALINQHIKRVQQVELNSFRLPFTGGGYYIMPLSVAHAAGHDINVQPGEMRIDPAYQSAIINDADYERTVKILGGADNDDRLNIVQFTDHDGEQRIIAWRCPNQLGEYTVFKPAKDCHTILWQTTEGGTSYPEMDSRKLPPQIIDIDIEYRDVEVNEPEWGNTYSISLMTQAVKSAQENAGVLGGYCNALMVMEAVGIRPEYLPAPLEDVIDASVKTGASLGHVKRWLEAFTDRVIEKPLPIPQALTDRINTNKDLAIAKAHWLDRLVQAIELHINYVESQREQLAVQCAPPLEVIMVGEQYAGSGRRLRLAYAQAFKEARDGEEIEVTVDRAEQYSFAVLAGCGGEPKVMLGAAYDIYFENRAPSLSDGAIWQAGLAEYTIKALGQIVDEARTAIVIDASNAWFNLMKAGGLTQAKLPSQVKPSKAQPYRASVQTRAKDGKFNQREFAIEERDGRLVLVNERGVLIGYLPKGANAPYRTIKTVKAVGDRNGNLRILAVPAS